MVLHTQRRSGCPHRQACATVSSITCSANPSPTRDPTCASRPLCDPFTSKPDAFRKHRRLIPWCWRSLLKGSGVVTGLAASLLRLRRAACSVNIPGRPVRFVSRRPDNLVRTLRRVELLDARSVQHYALASIFTISVGTGTVIRSGTMILGWMPEMPAPVDSYVCIRSCATPGMRPAALRAA